MFESEKELISILDDCDRTVRRCVERHTPFLDFLDEYDDSYTVYALDGHESISEEQKLLEKYKGRIKVHQEIWGRAVGGGLCPDEEAKKNPQIRNGRFGGDGAMKRLKEISDGYSEKFSL